MSLTIKPAEDIHDFHETIQKEKGKIKYKDYEMIQNIRKQDIPEMKKTLEANIAYNTNFKKPNGEPWTPEELENANKYWKELLNSINTLEKSWSEGTLTIENHKDEVYKSTVSETQKKLKELFGNHGVNPITPPTIETQAMHESPETLIKGVQERLNNYANNSNGKYLNIEFKGTKIFTKEVTSIELYGITLFKKTTEGGDTAYRPIDLGSTFSLEESRLRKLKSVDVLYGEIIKKIEKSDKPTPGEPTITTQPIVTDAAPSNPSPVMTEGRELTSEDIKRLNEKYIGEHNIVDLVKNNTTLAPLINNPTRENILKLQGIIGYPGKKDGIMGPITLGKIKDYIKNQSNNPPLNADLRLQYNHTTFLNRDEHRRAWETFKSQPLIPEQQKNAENIQKNLLYIEFAKLYHQIATEANESKMGLAGLRTSKEAAKIQLEQFGKLIATATSNPQDTNIKNTLLTQIQSIDNTVGRVTNLIGERVNEISKIIEGTGTSDEKYVKMLNTLRGGYIDSGTTKAGDIIAPSIIESQASKNKEIKNIQDILSDTGIKTNLQAATSEKQVIDILTIKGISNSIAKDVASVWSDIKKNLVSNRDVLLENYKKQNPTKLSTAPADVDALIGEHIYAGSMEEFQRIALKDVIKSNGGLRSDPKVELFAQAEGIDTWSIRDSRKAAVTEGAITIAMMAIPMGIGMAVGRLAARGVTGLANLSKATSTGIEATANVGRLGTLARGAVGMERLEKSSRVYHLLGKGLPIAGESFTFTESFNIMNNLLYKDSLANWNDGSLSMKENVKNLAFFGILNSIQKLYQHTGLLIKPGSTVPAIVLKGSTQILAEAATITGTSLGTEVMFGREFHPTWEEFFQALLMTAVFKGIPKGKQNEKTPPQEPEPIIPIGPKPLALGYTPKYKKPKSGTMGSSEPIIMGGPKPAEPRNLPPTPESPINPQNGGSPKSDPTGKSRDSEKGSEKPKKNIDIEVLGEGNRRSPRKTDDIVDAEDVSKRKPRTNNNQPLQLGNSSGVGKVKPIMPANGEIIFPDYPVAVRVTKPELPIIKDISGTPEGIPKGEINLGLKNTNKFNDALLNERSSFRDAVNNAKQGDRLEIGENQYRRVNNGWQRLGKEELLAGKDYGNGTFRTNEQVMADWNMNKGIRVSRTIENGKPIETISYTPSINRNDIAHELSVGRYNTRNGNITNGTIEIGGKKMDISNKKYDDIRKDYAEALKIPDESIRARDLSQIDTRFAEQLILDSGNRAYVASAEEAAAMVNGLGKVAGYENKLTHTEIDGRHFVSLAR